MLLKLDIKAQTLQKLLYFAPNMNVRLVPKSLPLCSAAESADTQQKLAAQLAHVDAAPLARPGER